MYVVAIFTKARIFLGLILMALSYYDRASSYF
jgi:hypothetical protein